MSAENLEQRLKELSQENSYSPSSSLLESARAGSLRARRDSIYKVVKEMSENFNNELVNWASLHSEKWKQIQQLLIEAEGTIHTENNNDLDWSVKNIRNGLVPVGTHQDYAHPENDVFFDFQSNRFVFLPIPKESVAGQRKTFYFGINDLAREDYSQSFYERYCLDQLIPEEFTNRLAEYLRSEREKVGAAS